MCSKPRTGSLHQSKTLQSERVCLPRLTHPLAHINIAQALSSPLSHISGVAKMSWQPVIWCDVDHPHNAIFVRGWLKIRLPLAAAAAVTPLKKIRLVQEAVKRCKTPHNKNSEALPAGRGALPCAHIDIHKHTHTPSSWTWAVLWLRCGWSRRLSPPRRTPWGSRPAWARCRRCAELPRPRRLCFPAWQPGPLLSPGHRPPSDSAHKRGCRGSSASPNASYACLGGVSLNSRAGEPVDLDR